MSNGLYFAYVDTQRNGTRVLCRLLNDGKDYDEQMINCGIPFPLTCSRPPARGFKKGIQDGYVTFKRHGIEFSQKEVPVQPGFVTVEATCFEMSSDLDGDADGDTAWLGDEIKNITNDPRAKVIFREEQQWGKGNDWMWDEMKRVDSKGNLLMHCRKK